MSRYASHQSSSVRRSQWPQLRQLSRTSLDKLPSESPRSPDTVSSNSTVRLDSLRIGSRDGSQARAPRKCTVTVNESFARDEILLNLDLFGGDFRAGMLVSIGILGPEASKQQSTAAKRLDPTSSHGAPDEAAKRYLFVVKDMPKDLKARFPHVEIYVAKHIADAFGMKKGSQVLLAPVDESNPAVEASHVELTFKDQYLSRADMWRIAVGELADRSVYQGQMMYFMGTVKTQVSAVFVDGRKVHSAFFSKHTKPIFRSESARYVLFIQMAREMWEFDSDDSGDIMFNKVVNGFLPALFKKWADLKVKHLVTVVLFARVEYDTGITAELGNATFQNDYYTGIQTSGDKRPYKDFYRVVVSEMTSGEWTTILYQLRKEFNYFRRDISVHHLKAMDSIPNLSEEPGPRTGPTTRIKAESSRAMYGNVLEAINLASSLFAHDYIDRDLTRTGISVAVITPGSGVFEVDYETLRRTTEALVGNGIGIDLICVPKIPLHSVPIFRYRNPARVDGHGSKSKPSFSYGSTPKAPTPLGTSYRSLEGSFSPNRGSDVTRRSDAFAMHHNDEWCFALPQWLHVSYWSGRSDNTLSFEGIALSVADQPKQSLDDFAIRCRMYELQMKSVLEMNEIETLPLHQDPFFPTSIWQNSLSPKARLHDLREIASIPAQKIHDPLHDNVLGFQKAIADRHSKVGEKSLWKQLQEFDDARAKLQASHRRHLPPRVARDPGDGARHHGGETDVYSTSAGDRRSSFSSSTVAVNSGLSRRKNQDGSGPFTHSRKSSDSTAADNSRVSSLKVPKFLRQISLGQRGFGIAAPQAAVAQVQAEHVSAVKETAPATPNPGASKQVPAIPPKRPNSPLSMISNGSTPAREIGRSSALGSSKEFRSDTPSRPMFIKSAQPSMDKVPQTLNESLAATLRPSTIYRAENPEQKLSNLLRRADITEDDDAHRNKLLAGAVPELPAMLSPTTAMSPWLTVINPSNPEVEKVDMTRLYSRWQHVFVRPSAMKVMKWKSLCSPAAVPLTTEYFPSKEQFDREYQRQPYQIEQDEDDDIPEEPRSREEFLRELISLRFSQGFQVVIGPAVARAFGQKHIKVGDIFSRDREIEDGTSVFMAVGNTIHQLACVNGTEVEVTIYVRKPTEPTRQSDSMGAIYKPAIRTLLDRQYETVEIDVVTPKADRNWNSIDSFVAGHYDEMSDENMRFWRARYVLIPINSSKNLSNPKFADNDEEIRIEGIRYIAQQWLRHRYVPPSERRFQPQGPRRARDPNPLDIIYKTEDPSVVIAAELETLPLLEGLEPGTKRSQLVTSREQFKKSNFKIAALAEAMQQPVEEGGVRLQNRRWHLLLHCNCFIGSDMTSWLLDNFEDLESRAEAEALGNSLMVDKTREEEEPGLFVHVEKRHQFRDGQYFYQISSDYAKPQPPSWFNSARRNLVSIPPTPRSETTPRDSPQPPPSFARPTSTHDEDSSASSATTPTIPIGNNTRRPRVVLSKVMKYDVDPRKRSYRPERIDLHYDRLHNPDNCYHLRVEWMNTTPKLIHDAIESWARDMTRFGLRLVEVPIAEVHKINDINPFRAPYPINLVLPPPDRQPIAYYDPNSFAATTQPRKHFYQKAILRKMDFVLDMEAAADYPSNVEVTYSWGKPDYKYPQYIHRSGTILAQITDEGNFLLLGNRMHTTRSVMAARERELRNEQQTLIDRRNGGGPLATAANTLASHSGFAPTPNSSPMVRPAMYASPVLRAANTLPPPPSSVPSLASAAATTAAPISSSLGMGVGMGTGTGMGSSDGPTTAPSRAPAIEPASVGGESWMVKDELEQFCHDKSALEAFYREMLEQAQMLASGSSRLQPTIITTPGMGPVGPVADVNIPVIGLPPGVLGQHNHHNHTPHYHHPYQYQAQSEDSLSGSVRTASPGPGPTAQRTSSPGIATTAARLLRRGSIQRN